MKAIPTTYRGVNMRSRLEARWADLLNQFGWNWYYEPLDFNGWIPDFIVDGHGYKPVLVDVKPFTSFKTGDVLDVKIRRAVGRELKKYSLFVTRAYPVDDTMGAHVGWIYDDLGNPAEPHWFDAVILRPRGGSKVFGLTTDCSTYTDLITGIYDDGGYTTLSQSEFMPFWHRAINATQWKRAA